MGKSIKKKKEIYQQEISKGIIDTKNKNSLHVPPCIKVLNKGKLFPSKEIEEFYKQSLILTNTGFLLYSHSENTIWFSEELVKILNISIKNNQINKENLKKISTEDNSGFIEIITKNYKKLPKKEVLLYIHADNKYKQQRILVYRPFLITNKQKNIKKTLGIITNITDHKRHEEEIIKAKEKAEESDKIKSIFLKNISHEIRTPMNAIIGFNELLYINDISPDIKNEYLTIIKNKSKYLLSLIDDIVELSKFESGEMTVNKTETNLTKLFNELIQEFNKEIQKRKKNNIDLYLKLPIEQNIPVIYTDSSRIYQVMAYLLDNALKFTEKGYIQFGYEIKDNKNFLFFVKDTGIGIPKEAQKYLFNRFKVNKEVYYKNFLNKGLGLTISRALVELLGGKIHVESEPGKGSTFYFTLPLNKSKKDTSPERSENTERYAKWRDKVILVAEDDEVNYRFIEAIFAKTQVQLLHVIDGQQAIELCRTINKIDLILMDIKMPEKSGYEAIKEIKKFRTDIPIIVQTAYAQKEDKIKCFEAGCNDYISKPIDINLLFSKIKLIFNE